MAWCLSTRASVATALSMHAYVSSCLWVKDFWSTQLVVMCIHNSIYLLYFSLHPQYDHTKVMVINDQAIPFCSKSIIYPFPEIQLFQNVTLKIQGQGHGWGQRTRSHNGTLIANDTYAITNRVFAHENTHPKLWNKIHHQKNSNRNPAKSKQVRIYAFKVYICQFLHEYFEQTTFYTASIYTENRELPSPQLCCNQQRWSLSI